MKNVNYSNKEDILLTALNERYQAMRVIRERVQSIGVWALGIMVAAAGWLTQSKAYMPAGQIFIYLLAIGAALWALRFRYLNDLEKGFSEQQRVAVRLEKTLGFFTPGIFDEEKDPIYPKKWEQAGSDNSEGKFFSSTYLLLYTGAVILALSLLTHFNLNLFFCWFDSIFIHHNSLRMFL